VTFDLAQQPNKMPFNDKATPADSLEYEWGVYVDADGSGDAQYEVCLVHFKGKGARATSDTLENQCEASVYDLGSEDGAQVYFTALYYPGGESYIP